MNIKQNLILQFTSKSQSAVKSIISSKCQAERRGAGKMLLCKKIHFYRKSARSLSYSHRRGRLKVVNDSSPLVENIYDFITT